MQKVRNSSGADKRKTISNYDTSNIFGTNTL